jgi:hypothetical protein
MGVGRKAFAGGGVEAEAPEVVPETSAVSRKSWQRDWVTELDEEGETPEASGAPEAIPTEPAAGKKPGFFDRLFAEPEKEKEKEIVGKDTVLEGTNRLIELAEEGNDLLRDIFNRLPKPTAPSVKREEEIEAGKKKRAAMLAAAGGAGAGAGDGDGEGGGLWKLAASWMGLDRLKGMWKGWRAKRKARKLARPPRLGWGKRILNALKKVPKVGKVVAGAAAAGAVVKPVVPPISQVLKTLVPGTGVVDTAKVAAQKAAAAVKPEAAAAVVKPGATKGILGSLKGLKGKGGPVVTTALAAAFIGMEVAEANEAKEALDDLMKERETAKGEALQKLDAKIKEEMTNVHEQEKDITQEVAGTGGAIAGAIAGQLAIPIPIVGALIGGTIGYFGASWLGGMAHDMVKPQEDLVGVLREQEKEAARTANEAVKKAGDVEAAQAMLDGEAQSLRDEIAKHQAKIDKGDDRYGFGNVFSRKSEIENLEEELRIKEAALKTFQAPKDEVKPETTAAGTAPTVADEDTGRGDESIEGTGSAVLDDLLFKAQERSVDEAEIKGLTEQQVQLQTEQTADQKIVADVLGQAQAGNTIPLAVALYSKEGKDLGIKSTAAGVPVQPTTTAVTVPQFVDIGQVGASTDAEPTTTAVTVPQFLEPIKKAFLAVVDWFKGLWTWASDAISGVWTGLTEFIQGVWDGVVNWFKGLWAWDEKAGAAIAGAWTGVTDFIKGVWDSVIGWFKGLWEWASAGIAEGWTNVTDFIKGIWDNAIAWFKGLWEWDPTGIAEGWTNVTDFIKGIWDNAIA